MEENANGRGLRLPRRLPDRILLGCVAVPMAALSGTGLFLMLTETHAANAQQSVLLHIVMGELLGTVFVLSAGPFLWVTTQPTWLERLLSHTAGRAALIWFGVSIGLVAWGAYVVSSR